MQIDIMSGVVRRRRWSLDQKRALVSAAFAPGAVISRVAREADVSTGLLYRWRDELRSSCTTFAEVLVAGSPPCSPGRSNPVIEVISRSGVEVRIPLASPPDLAAAIVRALGPR